VTYQLNFTSVGKESKVRSNKKKAQIRVAIQALKSMTGPEKQIFATNERWEIDKKNCTTKAKEKVIPIEF